MTPELRLLKLKKEKHDAIEALGAAYDRRIARLMKKLDVPCKHPLEARVVFYWVWDSGYGSQKKKEHCDEVPSRTSWEVPAVCR